MSFPVASPQIKLAFVDANFAILYYNVSLCMSLTDGTEVISDRGEDSCASGLCRKRLCLIHVGALSARQWPCSLFRSCVKRVGPVSRRRINMVISRIYKLTDRLQVLWCFWVSKGGRSGGRLSLEIWLGMKSRTKFSLWKWFCLVMKIIFVQYRRARGGVRKRVPHQIIFFYI